MDEKPFLQAVGPNPADHLTRLVYADWLDEHAEPGRAELLRIQARLATLPPDDPTFRTLTARREELRAGCSPYWLARIDPPVWCVVGNVRGERPAGPGGAETRRGTRVFRPNAKVYLVSLEHAGGVFLDDASPIRARVRVLGQQRQSRRWVVSWVRAQYVTSWRIKLVHQPAVVVRLREEGWAGFGLGPDEFTWPGDRNTPGAVRALLDAAEVPGRVRQPPGG